MGASDYKRTPPVKDRILCWPTVLSAFWYWYFTLPPVEYSDGDLHPGPILILAGPVLSVAIAVLLCIFWIGVGGVAARAVHLDIAARRFVADLFRRILNEV
jgi:hypothetical protein